MWDWWIFNSAGFIKLNNVGFTAWTFNSVGIIDLDRVGLIDQNSAGLKWDP